MIFDNDPNKHGTSVEGIKVVSLDNDPVEIKKEIDAVIIASPTYADEIYEQISYWQDYNIDVYRVTDL